MNQAQWSSTPPFPERLALEKKIKQTGYDLLDELNNICIRIPLLQEIKDIPMYDETVRELCINKSWRKNKDPQTMHVIVNWQTLYRVKFICKKYVDPSRTIVKIHINNAAIENTLIYLWATINVMTKGTMDELKLSIICNTPIVLQLVERSTIKPKNILGDIIVSLDSWEYHVDFSWNLTRVDTH